MSVGFRFGDSYRISKLRELVTFQKRHMEAFFQFKDFCIKCEFTQLNEEQWMWCDANFEGGDVEREERSDEPERQLGLALCQTKEKVRGQQMEGALLMAFF